MTSNLDRRLSVLEAQVQETSVQEYCIVWRVSGADWEHWSNPNTPIKAARTIERKYGIGPLSDNERIVSFIITIVDDSGEAGVVQEARRSTGQRTKRSADQDVSVCDRRARPGNPPTRARDLHPVSGRVRPSHWAKPSIPGRRWVARVGIINEEAL